MQISRHWRLNAQRYRLEGVRYENGKTRVEDRRSDLHETSNSDNVAELRADSKTKVNAA